MNELKKNGASGAANRWGIILSGGNGMRLRDLVYRTRADHLPKQYLNFIGRRSMLEHTLHRAEKLLPSERLFIVIGKEHLRFEDVRRQIGSRPRECVLVQPDNKDTGPGIMLPLTHLHRRDPDAVIALFPSDHFILEEDLFMRYVDDAFLEVEADGSRILLLGTEPNAPDPEYGYIVPGENIENSVLGRIRRVELFVEKPASDTAKKIIRSGALWNTLVVVCTCKTLLKAIEKTTPELHRSFKPILNAIGTADEQGVTERVYQGLPALNFSRAVLAVLSSEYRPALAVLPVRGVTWSDWGTSARLLSTLQELGKAIHTSAEEPGAGA